MLNGCIVGGTSNHIRFINDFKEARSRCDWLKQVSVFQNDMDRFIEIWSDAGRMIRPLINAKNLKENYN